MFDIHGFPRHGLQTVRKVLARLKYPVPLYKARSGFSILTEECLTFRTTSPKLLKQHKIRKQARSSAKPCLFSCPYKACRYLQRRFWYSHRDSNPNRQNRNLKSYPLDYGSKRGQEQMPPCGIDFPHLCCKVNYFND